VKNGYKEDNWGDPNSWDLAVIWALQGRQKRDDAIVELRDIRMTGKTWGREAKESPLLEAVARERLVKTQQAGQGLAGAVVICELLRLTAAL
jgi:hypothetical protein